MTSNSKAYEAISSFVSDLWEVFGNPKKKSTLAIYKRLLDTTDPKDENRVTKVIEGFQKFLVVFENDIMNNNLDNIPRGTVIRFGTSDIVKLEIQKFIYQSEDDIQEAIRQHLITISAIIQPSKEKINSLRQMEKRKLPELNIDSSTKEGAFINDIMNKAKDTMENVDTENPGAAIMGLLQSGVIQDMVTGLQSSAQSGEMDMGKLLGTMQGAIGTLMPQKKPSVEEVVEEEMKNKKE